MHVYSYSSYSIIRQSRSLARLVMHDCGSVALMTKGVAGICSSSLHSHLYSMIGPYASMETYIAIEDHCVMANSNARDVSYFSFQQHLRNCMMAIRAEGTSHLLL